MHDLLAKPDVLLTNAKDKLTMLPVVRNTNEHVQEMLAKQLPPHLFMKESSQNSSESDLSHSALSLIHI
eukprot:7319609-Prymnesium_polylepis.1